MPICSRCQNQVKATALVCPHCGLQLKAHGHPSIELYQAGSEELLCASCIYHEDDSCTFPQRPYAQSCTLYQSIQAEDEQMLEVKPSFSFRNIWERYRVWLVLVALFGISLLITIV